MQFSCMPTGQLIGDFVFAYAKKKNRFSYDAENEFCLVANPKAGFHKMSQMCVL